MRIDRSYIFRFSDVGAWRVPRLFSIGFRGHTLRNILCNKLAESHFFQFRFTNDIANNINIYVCYSVVVLWPQCWNL